MKNVYKPDNSFKFPFTQFSGRNRSFQHNWLARYPGLCYSPQLDAAFCIYCVLFSTNTDKRGKLVKNPYRNWKKATEQFDEHFLHKRHNSGDTSVSSHKLTGTGYQAHRHCMTLGLNFLDVMENSSKSVDVALNTALDERKQKNAKILKTIVDTVILCGRQNLPFRGHRDDSKYFNDTSINCGNFKALLQYRAKGGDTDLAEHLSNAPKNATYISKTIQNELINIIGETIQKRLVQEIIESGGYFALMADEVRDSANKEQLAVTLRFTDRKGLSNKDMFDTK